MATINYLMRKKNGSIWDTYYPVSIAGNINTIDGSNVQTKLDTIYDKTATVTENGAMSKEDKATLLSIKERIDEALGPNASSGSFVPKIEKSDDRRYLRNDNTWQTITPIKIGAISNTGGIVSGEYIFKNTEPSIALSPNINTGVWEQGINIYSYNNSVIGGMRIKGNNSAVNNIGFYIGDSNEPIFNIESERILFKQTEIYSELNKPTPQDIGAIGLLDAAASAKKLTNIVNINGVSFDGSKDITIPIYGGNVSTDINLNYDNAKIKYKNRNLISTYETSLSIAYGASFSAGSRIIIAHNSIENTLKNKYDAKEIKLMIGSRYGISFYTSDDNVTNNEPIEFTRYNDISGIKSITPVNDDLAYQALTIKGSKNNYSSGIYFEDAEQYFLVNNISKTNGVFIDGKYSWGFTNGVLNYGSVPWGRLIELPASFKPSEHTHSDYINKTSTVTGFYAGTSVPDNNDGKENGTVYLKYDN